MLSDSKRKAIGYWEKRRIIFNLLLVPASWLAWQISSEFTYHIDDQTPASLTDPRVLVALVFLCISANICYSFVYVLEFFLLDENPTRFWPFPGRTIFLILGCILGMLLATRAIGQLQVDLAGPILPYDP
jgi:hypothetical protein